MPGPVGLGNFSVEQAIKIPSDEQISNIFHKRLREMNLQRISAVAIYFVAAFEFGAPAWKSSIIAGAVAYAIFVGLGRGILVRAAPILLILALVEFSGVLPPMSQWAAFAGSLISRNMANAGAQ